MSNPSLSHLLVGPFHYLLPQPEDIGRVIPNAGSTLPHPHRIFLEDESATPLWGFPVLMSADFQKLRAALNRYLQQEEQSQVAQVKRERSDPRAFDQAWEIYRQFLSRALENVTLSSYGRHYPGIFWLAHSLDVARALKETPKRILRLDTTVGRTHGDLIKYRVFDRYQDRLLSTTYDLVKRLSVDTEEMEEELFPKLLRRMLDNVLVFTEDFVTESLEELNSYFHGTLRIDGRAFLRSRELLLRWHRQQLAQDPMLQGAVQHLLGGKEAENADSMLRHPGYVSFLSTLESYDRESLWNDDQVRIWESLLTSLKEFEVFHALRRLVVPIEKRGESLLCPQRVAGRVGADTGTLGGGERGPLKLSYATRPLDFMEAWVVDPVVERFGMIYDITDFTSVISVLRLSGADAQDHSFRMMFRFQRRINRLASSHRMKLEKYLGDGAFYSSRHPLELLICAVRLQRYYLQALEEGLPFDRGLRIALNYGTYRLVPLRSDGSEAERYEFFGHGLVELSRLTTGKVTREIDDTMNMLVAQGYPEATVQRFFAPMLDRRRTRQAQAEEGRRFYAYVNSNRHLVNEGIVATEVFIARLETSLQREPRVSEGRVGQRWFLVVRLEDQVSGGSFQIGLRKLGVTQLKGLDALSVYEIIDGETVEQDSLQPIPFVDTLRRTLDGVRARHPER